MYTSSRPLSKKPLVIPQFTSIQDSELGRAYEEFQTAASADKKHEKLGNLIEKLHILSSCPSWELGFGWIQVARISLRYGAWELLDGAMRNVFHFMRMNPPCSLQSIASGLASEWAMAAGNGSVALIYAREAMATRTEPQRIRGYLAIIHALLDDRTTAMMQMACAIGASHRQFRDEIQEDFAKLHRLRVRLILNEDPDFDWKDFHETNESVRAQVICTLLAIRSSCLEESDVQFAVSHLQKLGRYRDLMLCRPLLEHEEPGLFDNISSITQSMDALLSLFPTLQPYPLTDAPWLGTLPKSLNGLPTRNILSCI